MSSQQLSFFDKSADRVDGADCKDSSVWQLFTDGAARNNPGPAGIGFCLKKDDKIVCEQGFYVGEKTNNQAEYLALLIGLLFAKKFVQPAEKIAVFSDSQLLIRQMIGQYRVKDARLKRLQELIFKYLQGYEYSFCHVYRTENTQADELANRGVDKKTPLPKQILDIVQPYEIL